MIKSFFASSLVVLSLSLTTGCGGREGSSVIAPPSDAAALEAQRAAEEAYDKELAESNQ